MKPEVKRHSLSWVATLIGSGALLAPVITLAATATGATMGTTSKTMVATQSMPAGAMISAELKSDNPQALQFEDNGIVIKQTRNIQVNSYGSMVMAKSEPAWMSNSGIYMNKARDKGLYVPGEISYLKAVKPKVVLQIQSYGAAIYQDPKGGINNPTLIVPANKPVTFVVMDLSNGYPGTFTVVKSKPPYPTFIDLAELHPVFNSGWINRSPLSGAYAPYRTVTYTFAHPGTYYYLSLQPGNAAAGEWGKIIVKSTATHGGA